MKTRLVRDIVPRNVISLPPEAPFGEALAILDERKISFLLVESDHKPVGVLTERDIVRLAAGHEVNGQSPLHRVMTSPVHTIRESNDIFEAYEELVTHQIRHLVVTDEHGNATGLLTQSDFLANLGIEHFVEPKHLSSIMTRTISTLPPDATVQKALDIMAGQLISCVIVAEKGRPVGIWTERDVPRFLQSRGDPMATFMREVMSTPVEILPESAHLPEVNQLMAEKKIRHVVVVDSRGRLAGLISQSNLTRGIEEKYISNPLQNPSNFL